MGSCPASGWPGYISMLLIWDICLCGWYGAELPFKGRYGPSGSKLQLIHLAKTQLSKADSFPQRRTLTLSLPAINAVAICGTVFGPSIGIAHIVWQPAMAKGFCNFVTPVIYVY